MKNMLSLFYKGEFICLNQKISGISFSPYLEGQDPSVKSVISHE